MKKKETQQTQYSIVLYQNDDSNVCVSVYYNNEIFWLTQKAMAGMQLLLKLLGNSCPVALSSAACGIRVRKANTNNSSTVVMATMRRAKVCL